MAVTLAVNIRSSGCGGSAQEGDSVFRLAGARGTHPPGHYRKTSRAMHLASAAGI